MSLLTATERADLAQEQAAALPHTYTRVPCVRGAAADEEDVPSETAGTPIAGLACLYRAAGSALRDSRGLVVTQTPTLAVLPADLLAPNDWVQSILDANGATLAAGPFRVETIVGAADAGAVLLRRATLRAGGRV